MAKLRFKVVRLVSVVLFCSVLGLGQNPPAPSSPLPARPQFFAGTVLELDQQHIRVTRTLIGRPTESRTFVINGATKLSKIAIKLRSRVTVRYKRLPEGDVALEIQPRPVVASTPKA